MIRKLRTSLAPLLQALDTLATVLSPLVIILFLVLCIAVLDGLGQHVQFLRVLDRDTVTVDAVWGGMDDPEDEIVTAERIDGDDEYDGVVLYTRYYSRRTLESLHKGQVVRVRFPAGSDVSPVAILADAEDEVRGYHGYLTDLWLPLLIAWLWLATHPDFLFFGLADVSDLLDRRAAKKGAAR